MVDTGVSKAPAFGFAGSSPAPGTNVMSKYIEVHGGPRFCFRTGTNFEPGTSAVR